MASGRMSRPAGVSTTARLVRSNSGSPSSRSSALICSLTDGCATCSRSAAREKSGILRDRDEVLELTQLHRGQ